jgi:hypothetical protein
MLFPPGQKLVVGYLVSPEMGTAAKQAAGKKWIMPCYRKKSRVAKNEVRERFSGTEPF